MPEYTLYYSSVASCTVTVEADDLESAIDKGYDQLPHSVCAQCAGWGSSRPGIDLNDVWELDEKAARDDYPDEQ